jgi:hypothetical protein
METTHKSQLLDYSKENVKLVSDKIQAFINEKGYRLSIPVIKISEDIVFESKKKSKVLRRYLTLINNRISLKTINRFLHFLYKKIYKEAEAPKVLISEKETKIQDARKAWKKIQAESVKLEKIYKEEKGNFYK